MKVEFTNPAHRYIVCYFGHDHEWEDAVPYEDINDALAAAEREIDDRLQALGAHIIDAETGEIYASCYYDFDSEEDDDYPDWDDDVDETFYNPYMGCDDFEVGGYDEW